MSTSSFKQNDSDDEFESADEGEPVSPTITKPPTPPPVKLPEKPVQSSPQKTAVTDGWDDWNIDDDDEEPIIETTSKPSQTLQQDSVSSRSSSTSKTGGSLSHIGSDEDEQIDSSNQQRLQRKKYRKKPLEINLTREDSSITSHVPPSSQEQNKEKSLTMKHEPKDAHHLLDQLAAEAPTQASTWHNSWSNFGSFLSTAKQSVSTLTNTVSEGFNAVIESVEAGLGAPDPQKLAEMNQMAFKIKGETSDSEDEPEPSPAQIERDESAVNHDGWLNALSLEKLTTTGMKVVSGSLDVLETVGKKTFDVINEADPELKNTRRLLSKKNQPTLSEIIREVKNEKENQSATTTAKNEPATFLQLFEKHLGLAHFEALELLSNQSSVVLQTMSYGNEKLLEQIDNYFQIPDDDIEEQFDRLNLNEENSIPNLDNLTQKFTAYQTQLRSTVSVDKLLETYESADQFLKEWDWIDTELDQKTLADEAIDSLAILSARIIEYYRKTAELFLIGCKSLTSFSIDIELLSIYEKQQKDFLNMLIGIPNLFSKHMKQVSTIPLNGANMPIKCDEKFKQKLLNQMFIQSSSSQTYVSDAYLLLKPIISQSILYHTSTTR